VGYSFSTLNQKSVSYQDPANNNTSTEYLVSVKNFGLGSGLIISPTLFYTKQIGNFGLSFKLGYRVQGYSLNIQNKNNTNNFVEFYPVGALQSARLSVGISRIHYRQ
jgi:hypothetical protein